MKILNSSSRFMRRLILAACSLVAILVVVNAHLLVGQLQMAGTAYSSAPMKVDDVDITCTISAQKTNYVVGEAPEIFVFLHNNEGRSVTLVGSLDGSDGNRSPRCHFEIVAPPGHEPAAIGRCGNINPIRMADFVDVPAGGKFDPFMRVDDYGFFSNPKLRWDNFVTPGRYHFTFRYSTVGWTKIKDDGRGLGIPALAASWRLKDVPKFEATSNTIELTFGPPPNGFVYGTKVPISRASNRNTFFISRLFSESEFKGSELDIVWLLGRPIGNSGPNGLRNSLLEFERGLRWQVPLRGDRGQHNWMQHVITPDKVWTSDTATHAAWKVSTMDRSEGTKLDEISVEELGRREILSGLRQTVKAFSVDATDESRKAVIFVVTEERLLPGDVSAHVPKGAVSPVVCRIAIKDGSWIPYPVAVPEAD